MGTEKKPEKPKIPKTPKTPKTNRKFGEKTSIFDPYREQIIEGLNTGLTLNEILEQLPAGYIGKSLYSYIYNNNLREYGWTREVEHRNKCDKCKYCKSVRNLKGQYDKSCRLCTKSWRMIQASVVFSPKWCEFERGTIK